MTRPRSASFGSFTATINDVAARAGVSKRTVSRVMNQEPNITADTRDRVLEVVRRLGYRPNPAARKLASGRSHLIGLFHSGCLPPDLVLVDQVTIELARQNYHVLVCSVNVRASNPVEESIALSRIVPIDGAILCAPVCEQTQLATALHARRIPCVQLGAAGRHGVSVDEAGAAGQAVRLLVSLGHSSIGLICGPGNSETAQQRRRGLIGALQSAGLPCDANLILQGSDSFVSGLECARRLLDPARGRATAIIADTDHMAAGALVAAHEKGLRVPGELSVIGFGDSPIARHVWPALTSVRPPSREMATRAATLLLGLLNGSDQDAEVPAPLSPTLIVRNSTAAPVARHG